MPAMCRMRPERAMKRCLPCISGPATSRRTRASRRRHDVAGATGRSPVGGCGVDRRAPCRSPLRAFVAGYSRSPFVTQEQAAPQDAIERAGRILWLMERAQRLMANAALRGDADNGFQIPDPRIVG